MQHPQTRHEPERRTQRNDIHETRQNFSLYEIEITKGEDRNWKSKSDPEELSLGAGFEGKNNNLADCSIAGIKEKFSGVNYKTLKKGGEFTASKCC